MDVTLFMGVPHCESGILITNKTYLRTKIGACLSLKQTLTCLSPKILALVTFFLGESLVRAITYHARMLSTYNIPSLHARVDVPRF